MQSVFITVDPARDATEALREYLAPFDQRIIGLIGSDGQIARAVATFGAQYFRVLGSTAEEYTVTPSSQIYVTGPGGGIVTQFSNADDSDRMAKTLSILIKQNGPRLRTPH